MLSKVTLKVSRLSVPCIWRIKKSKSSLHQDCIDLKTKINSLETCWLPCQRIMPDMKRWSLFPSYISWYLPFSSKKIFKIWGLAAWIGYFQYIFFLNKILGSNFHLDNQIKNIKNPKIATNIQSVWKTALYFNVVAWLGWAVNMAEQCLAELSSAEHGNKRRGWPFNTNGRVVPSQTCFQPIPFWKVAFLCKKRCPIA